MTEIASREHAATWLRKIADRIESGEYTDQAFVLVQRADGALATHDGFRCVATLIGGLDHALRYQRAQDDRNTQKELDEDAPNPLDGIEERVGDVMVEIIRRAGGPDISRPPEGSS